MQYSGQLVVESQEERQCLEELAVDVIAQAKQRGATAAEVGLNVDAGYSLTVRLGEIETLEYHRDKGVSVSVYFGQCTGAASTSDTSPAAIAETVEAACNIAKYTSEDDCNGLADADKLAYDYPDLELAHPWDMPPEQAIELMQQCEQQARDHDKRINNSEGASLNTLSTYNVYANSHGFVGSFPTSRHGINCVLVAEDASGMQRDYSYTVARDADDLESIDFIAKEAAENTVGRLQARRLQTCQIPVVFRANVARGLLATLAAAVSGSSLYRKSSFLLDHLDKQIFPEFVDIIEQPHLPKALGSVPFDSEGVKTSGRSLVEQGVLKGYVLSSYSARKLGLQTTGNAGGVHNLTINHGDHDLAALLKTMDKGLLVTDTMGHGVNVVTGDYSQGAAGYWVEHGEIQYPVHEITVASNFKDIFQGLVAVGNDMDCRGSVRSGSWLINQMTIAGE